jgi:hypothetical protein
MSQLEKQIDLLNLIRGVMMGVTAMLGEPPKHLYVGARMGAALKRIFGIKHPSGREPLRCFGMLVHFRLDIDENTVLCTVEPLPDPHPARDKAIFAVGLKT